MRFLQGTDRQMEVKKVKNEVMQNGMEAAISYLRKQDQIIQEGAKEAYDLLVQQIIEEVTDTLYDRDLDRYLLLDHSNEVMDFMKKTLEEDPDSDIIYDVVHPARLVIIKRIKDALQKEFQIEDE